MIDFEWLVCDPACQVRRGQVSIVSHHGAVSIAAVKRLRRAIEDLAFLVKQFTDLSYRMSGYSSLRNNPSTSPGRCVFPRVWVSLPGRGFSLCMPCAFPGGEVAMINGNRDC